MSNCMVLPEHMHAIWTLPPGDHAIGIRWGLIKSGFSRALHKTEHRRSSRIARGERGIWQRRFWEHQIRDDADMTAHIDYIHYNPVKHGPDSYQSSSELRSPPGKRLGPMSWARQRRDQALDGPPNLRLMRIGTNQESS